jgi:hypothetical protein
MPVGYDCAEHMKCWKVIASSGNVFQRQNPLNLRQCSVACLDDGLFLLKSRVASHTKIVDSKPYAEFTRKDLNGFVKTGPALNGNANDLGLGRLGPQGAEII